MKRIYAFILVLILVLSMSTAAFATSSQTYQLDDLGMGIDIPSEYVVFTRDIDDNDPNLSAYGLNGKDLSDLMESRNIYLNAWDEAVSFEIIVTMIDSAISDFNLMSDTTLTAMVSYFETEYASIGVTVEKYEIYQHDQAKFIKIYINQPNGSDKAYGLQYYTVYDNKAINVTMHSYSGKMDSEKESVLESIVNTVHFDSDPLLPETVSETRAFVYKDRDTGSEFIVPANWSQDSLSQDREFLDVKFTSNKEPGLSILYGSTDMWAEMSSSEIEGLSRSYINNSLFTLDELAEAIGVEQSEISTISYGGKEYYKYVVTTTSSTYGIDIEVTMTCLMRIENGYSYTFQFSGDSKNEYYKDFESLLESVKYPEVEGDPLSDDFSDFSVNSILLNLLITIIIYSAPIIIYRYGIVKQPVEKAKAKKITIIYGIVAFFVMSILIFNINGGGAAGGAVLLWSWINYRVLISGKKPPVKDTAGEEPHRVPLEVNLAEKVPIAKAMVDGFHAGDIQRVQIDTEESQTPENGFPHRILYCRRCGSKLVEGSKFCSNCGTQVVKEDAQ